MKQRVRHLSVLSLAILAMLALTFTSTGCSSGTSPTQPEDPIVHEPPAAPSPDSMQKGIDVEREPDTGEQPDPAN